jgi:ferredoxin
LYLGRKLKEGFHSMPVQIDVDLCTGCGLCEETCPTIFKLDDDEGVAKAVNANPEGEDLECAKRASEECPVEAISIS